MPSIFCLINKNAVCLNSCERARASAVATLCRLFCPRLSHFPFSFASFSALSAKFGQQEMLITDAENVFEMSVANFASRVADVGNNGDESARSAYPVSPVSPSSPSSPSSLGPLSAVISAANSSDQAALTMGRDPLSDRDVEWMHKFIFMVGKVSRLGFLLWWLF